MKIRDRIVELRRVKASELLPNPRNWRTHPKGQQDALKGVLAEVGYADALLAREVEGGSLMLIDGHLRAETTPDQEVPVLVLDVNEDEADKILATLDPLAAMAEASAEKLEELLGDVKTNSEAVDAMLSGMLGHDIAEDGTAIQLNPLDVKAPPKMAWVLVGIPVVRFGEIANIVEKLAEIDGTIVESTANDG